MPASLDPSHQQAYLRDNALNELCRSSPSEVICGILHWRRRMARPMWFSVFPPRRYSSSCLRSIWGSLRRSPSRQRRSKA